MHKNINKWNFRFMIWPTLRISIIALGIKKYVCIDIWCIYICEWFIESWRRKTYGLFWAVTNLKTGFKKIQERDLGSRIYFIFFIWPVALSCYTQTAVENSIFLIFTWKHTWDPYFRNSGVNRTKYLKHFILKEKRNNPQLVWFYKTQVNSLEVKGW